MLCPFCRKDALWVENKEVYGRNFGKSIMMWLCKPCDAYVGCHNNTRKPLGTMANKEMREWRKKAHAKFDPLWKFDTKTFSVGSIQKRQGKSHSVRRGKAYSMLKKHFGYEVHIGEADIETCKRIIDLVNANAEAHI